MAEAALFSLLLAASVPELPAVRELWLFHSAHPDNVTAVSAVRVNSAVFFIKFR